MEKKISMFFSFLFHPLLIPLAGIMTLLYSGSYLASIPPQSKKMIILLFASGTLFLPLLMIPVFLYRRMISGIHMDSRVERLIPYSFMIIFYMFTYMLLRRLPVYHFMHSWMLGCLLSVIVLFILNLRWKISAHTTGLGGLTALIAVTSVYMEVNLLILLIMSIVVSGITATSRLILAAHTPAEIYTGFLSGFFIMTSSLIML